MDKLTAEEAATFADARESPTNKSAYTRNPFHGGMDPYTIYLYYWDDVDPNDDHPKPRFFVREYGLPIRNEDQLTRLITKFGQDVADGSIQSTVTGFDAVDWIRKSYFVTLIPDRATFIVGQAIAFYDAGDGYEGNHTFFDGFHPEVTLAIGGQAKKASVLCLKNWMVNAGRQDLESGRREKFHWDFQVKIGHEKYRATIDPGGNNLGPPIAPP